MIEDAEAAYQELRQFCLTDPLAAKRRIIALLDTQDPLFGALLARAGGPDDGRLRQTIARSLQKRPEVASFASTLRAWRARETDEFALSALEDVLTIDSLPTRRPHRMDDLPYVVETFRFLSGRLRHRVRNAMPRAGLKIDQLRTVVQRSAEPTEEVLQRLDELRSVLAAVEAAVDFGEETALFERRVLDLVSWLGTFRTLYLRSYPHMSISIGTDEGEAWVSAEEFLLETIFRNLWDNSRQGAEDRCAVTTAIRAERDALLVQVVDSGPGFSADDPERAFQLQYSSTRRAGRGHMEVNDAISRLGGTASVRPVAGAGYRVVLSFPRATP